MSADIIPFVPRRDRKRSAIDFSIPATPPDDLVMDHVDTAPCEYVAPEDGEAVVIENIHA
jgi:hypothetical protein